MASRRPSSTALAVETELVERATAAGQGNRTRPRQHGDLAMYQWGPAGKDRSNGCRCEPCVEGNRAYKRRYARERTVARGGGFVALREVRPHVRRLLRLGWQIKQIAEHAQVMPGAVARVARSGRPDDDVKRHVAQALLAVPAVAWHRQQRHQLDEAMLERAAAVLAGRWAPDREVLGYAKDDAWMVAAACAGLDPESMHPGRGDSMRACRALCEVCPSRGECAEAGLYERFGVWGGLSERERRRVRRQRGIQLPDEEPAIEEVAA